MPLLKVSLSDALGAVFESFPDTAATAADKIAAAYGEYAAGAQALATAPVDAMLEAAVAAMSAAFAQALKAGMQAGTAGVAGALDTAFTAFWTAPPMAFLPPPPAPPTMTGLVWTVPAGVLSGALATVLTTGVTTTATARAQASNLADVLDDWTGKIMVRCTLVAPPGTVTDTPLV